MNFRLVGSDVLLLFLGIGIAMSIAVAFGSPFLWDSSAHPALYSSLTTAVAFTLFCSLGSWIDRRRKKDQSAS
ncbi:hypothetical protein [Glutamicibacter sp. JC586]|uniref:hypothetical protein n=1 Tax=Glutamicibacter sp. JC586 TaxID=2590552 RepID=UPI001357FDF9|nr:hypothetical protein [Glutamicibacter sp. JC586]